MSLVANVAAYVIFVLSICASQKWWKLLPRIGITKGGELIALLALTYLLMLVPQLLRDIRHGDTNGRLGLGLLSMVVANTIFGFRRL